MKAVATFRCPHCEPIQFPEPDNLQLFRSFYIAHGLTHGQDWRRNADTAMIMLASASARLHAREEQP